MAQTPVSVVTGAVTGLEADLLTLGGIGLGIGAAIFALKKGWGMVRSFVR